MLAHSPSLNRDSLGFENSDYSDRLLELGAGQRFRGSEIPYQAASATAGPSVDDGMAIDVVDAGHDALLEFVL